MKKLACAIALITGIVGANPAAAAPIVINGQINNIDGDHDGAADDLKISRILLKVTAGTRVFFDTLAYESTGVDLNGDEAITGFDMYAMLHRLPGGNLTDSVTLFANDDSWQTNSDGSVHAFDSTIDYTFDDAGLYLLTLGQLSYLPSEALQGFDRNRQFHAYIGHENFGAWRLTATTLSGSIASITALDDPQDVPEPAAFGLLGLGAIGIAASRRRPAIG